MTQPCEQHPHAPTFDGLCGGCTQYPADMVKPSRPAATEPVHCPCNGVHFPSPDRCRWCKCHRTGGPAAVPAATEATDDPKPTPLHKQIADAVQPLLMDTLPKPIAAARADDIADAVLAVINPIGKAIHAQMRHAERQLTATQATLADCLNSFHGYRNSDGLGDIQYWRSPQVLPHEMRRWQNAAGRGTANPT